MMTLQAMRQRTNWMMEQMRRDAIDQTLEEWKEATRRYYQNGCDNGETTRLYKELERLGANMDALIDIDFEIRDEVFGE